METTLPRIDRAYAISGTYKLSVRFAGEPDDTTIDLSGWTARLSPPLQAIRDPAIWTTAAVADCHDAIFWGATKTATSRSTRCT